MKTLPGFRDLYPADQARRTYLVSRWQRAARLYGFQQYDGPTLESAELYRKKNSGGEILGQLYEFTDKGERSVALRPEVTPTLARMVAAKHRDFSKPLRWFNVGSCFRYERQQRGRLREFLQFNCDLLGDASPAADAEVIALLIDLLRSFGLGQSDFVIRVSNRSAWGEFLAFHGCSEDRTTDFLAIVDKMEREDAAKMEEKLAPFGIPLSALQAFVKQSQIPALEPLMADLASRGLEGFVRPDLGVVRGLAYYTGVVFEAFALQGNLRAIAGGGRYDQLLSDLSDGSVNLPAVGFGIGDAVLLELLNECQVARELEEASLKADSPVQLYLVIANEGQRGNALILAQQLRERGWRLAFSLGADRVGRQFAAAEAAGASLALVIGDEWPMLRVKRLSDRTEVEIELSELQPWLCSQNMRPQEG